MRILVLTPDVEAAARAVVDFARRPENHFRPLEPGATSPGDKAEHCLLLGPFRDFRCVFSFTELEGKLWRHLSISVPTSLPNSVMCAEIAKLFEFEGDVHVDYVHHGAIHYAEMMQVLGDERS